MEEKKREECRQRKDSAQKRAIEYSFIYTVSSDYQCICSILSGVLIVFKNNRAHTQLIILHTCAFAYIIVNNIKFCSMAYHIPIYRAAMAQETFATSLDAKLCILARTARRSFRRASCGGECLQVQGLLKRLLFITIIK